MKKSLLRRRLGKKTRRQLQHQRRRSLAPESLESRLMLAGDLDLLDDGSSPAGPDLPEIQAPEGENVPAPDLVAFAQALAADNVKFYGAAWCPFCTQQKELFEDGGAFLPFIEVTNPDRTLNSEGTAANIQAFPTWEFQDGTRREGLLSLDEISTLSGIAIPTSANPFVAPVEDLSLLSGSPLHVALNGYDPNGGELTYTVTSSNPSLVTPTVLSGNRSLRVTVNGYGELVFELFEQRAPDITARVVELAESKFYDADVNDPDVGFHRIINNFVAQFGDPTGTGAGGSSLGDVDDQFHPELQHNQAGILSYAKSTDDTNDSQLFITDAATRHLDGNHSVVAMLTEGDSNRDALTSTLVDGNDRPVFGVNINSVSVFNDVENALLMLSSPEGASGSADITVTVTDEDGNTYQEMFTVNVTPDPFNTGPWLEEVSEFTTSVNTPAQFQLAAVDVEGDDVVFSGQNPTGVNYQFTVDPSTGATTVTPPTDFVGTLEMIVRVTSATASNTSDPFDSQRIMINVTPGQGLVDLDADSDTGFSDSDNITSDTTLQFLVSGVEDGATVRLFHGNDTFLGQATASGSTATITTSGLAADGTYNVFATQEVNGQVSSGFGNLDVTIDTTGPGNFNSTAPDSAEVGIEYLYNAVHPEELTPGFRYLLENAPAGMTVDATTGVVTWTPTLNQTGQHVYSLVAEDAAGNRTVQGVTVDVDPGQSARVLIRLETTDAQGNVLDNVSVGDSFLLRAFIEDQGNLGVFSGYFDVEWDSALAEVVGSITYGQRYPNVQSGDFSTPGLLDEVGATSGSIAPLGPGEFLLFSVEMEAVGSGQINFNTNAPDNLPFNEILVYGTTDEVPPDSVDFGNTSLTVDLTFAADNDLFNVDEDSQDNALDVLDNDDFLSGFSGTLTVTGVGTGNRGGTIEVGTGGADVLYTPAADFVGEETFTYTVSDGTASVTATVTVQVANVNDPPTAVDDTATIIEDTSDNLIDVLLNDEIAPDTNETLQVTGVGSSANGATVTVGPGGTHVRYTPPSNFFGEDTFTYTVTDGHGGTDTATVTVTVTEFNDPPVARSDAYDVDEDTQEFRASVLDNDDTAGDPGETVSITQVFTPSQGGTVTIDGDDLLYTPVADFFGRETVEYEVTDGNGNFATATVTFDVANTNDPPVANSDDLTAIRNRVEQFLDVLANDNAGVDGNEAIFLAANTPQTTAQGGTLSVNSDGDGLLYTPPQDFTGTDSFTYMLEDAGGEMSEASVSIEVLDFVPVDVSGTVYFDVDDDGVLDSDELRIGAIIVNLTGTDAQGNAVSLSTETDLDGNYSFVELVPGTYTVSAEQPNYTIDGRETAGSLGGDTSVNDQITFTIESGETATGYNFGEHGRDAPYISPLDFLASTPPRQVFAETNGDSGAKWYAFQGEWDGFDRAEFISSEGSTRLTVRSSSSAVTDSAFDITHTDPMVYFAFGELVSEATSLIRIVGDLDALSNFTVPPDVGGNPDDNSGGSGEGEAVVAAAAQPVIVNATQPAGDLTAATAPQTVAALSTNADPQLVGTGAEGEAPDLFSQTADVLDTEDNDVSDSQLQASVPAEVSDAWLTQIGEADAAAEWLADDSLLDENDSEYETGVDQYMEDLVEV